MMEDVIPHADRDAMYRQFEESPGDLTAYGVIADMLDELGHTSLAHAFRWMMKRGKFPHKRTHYTDMAGTKLRKVPARYRWAWYAEPLYHQSKLVLYVDPPARREMHALPRLIIPGDQSVYHSHQAAVMALAKWLERLKNAWDLEPRKVGL